MKNSIYAEVAPLPQAIADHLFARFRSPDNKEQAFITAVHEKERASFDVLDAFVQTNKLTRSKVREKLADYGHGIHDRTFNFWREWGLVENQSHGKIKPLSAQAILIAGMIDQGQREFLPSDGIPKGDTWRCYIQRHPRAGTEIWPSGRLNELPVATLCWTPMVSACWEDGWHLIGDPETFLGCMRFAGVQQPVRGQIWYDVTIEDIRLWSYYVADQYAHVTGNTLAPVQNLWRLLFDQLAVDRLGKGADYGRYRLSL